MSDIPVLDSPPAYQTDLNDRSVVTPEPIPTFELLITLIHSPKRVCTKNRKMKNLKPESENKGPFDISVYIGWDSFLNFLAAKLSVERAGLAIASFEWHWLKPASGPWLPVQDENGFTSMLKKVKSKPDPYIIVRMQVPIQRKAVEASGNAWDLDESESDSESNTIRKKVRAIQRGAMVSGAPSGLSDNSVSRRQG